MFSNVQRSFMMAEPKTDSIIGDGNYFSDSGLQNLGSATGLFPGEAEFAFHLSGISGALCSSC